MGTAGNGGSRCREILAGKNDQYVGCVGDPAVLADKTEFLISLITAVGVGASPAALL